MPGASINLLDFGQNQIERSMMYREMLRSIPGLDGMYRLAAALIACRARKGSRVLIAGAGGGREIEMLGAFADTLDITAVDPCGQNLQGAKCVAQEIGVLDKITFFEGTIDEMRSPAAFDIATSLLVMHRLRDDGEELNYMSALHTRLTAGGMLIHADVCFDSPGEIASLTPAYMEHAKRVGIERHVTNFELQSIQKLPIVSGARTRALFAEAGFVEPDQIFRSLWYRCWSCVRSSA